MASERILVFDLIRITAIGMIVFLHMVIPSSPAAIPAFSRFPPAVEPWLSVPGPIAAGVGGLGGWGIVLLIFVSGAVLEYTYGEKIRSMDLTRFLKTRIWRIYPAYWLSVILALAINPLLLMKPPLEWIRTFSGFYIFFRPYLGVDIWPGGQIQPMGWFIGTIIALYLLYPVLTDVLREYKLSGLAGIFFVSWLSVMALDPANNNYTINYWFPLSRMFVFALGIYVVQTGFYPEWRSPDLVAFWAELSFYIFLVHFTLMPLIIRSYVGYTVIMVVVAILLYLVDTKIHSADWKNLLNRRDRA